MVRTIPPAPSKTRTSSRSNTIAAAAATLATTSSSILKQQSNLDAATDQLANDLTTNLSISSSSNTSKSAGRTITTTIKRTTTLVRSTKISSTSTLPSSVKSRQAPILEKDDPRTAAERASQAMRGVNLALQSLAKVISSTWRASTAAAPKRSTSTVTTLTSSTTTTVAAPTYTRAMVEDMARKGSLALDELRGLARAGKINKSIADTEKAAGSLVANLVELELYALALAQLSVMRDSILSSYERLSSPITVTSNSTLPLSFARLLSFPLPSTHIPRSGDLSIPAPVIRLEELVSLVLAVQQYTLGCLLRIDLSALELARRPDIILAALNTAGNPLDWREYLGQMDMDGGIEESVLKKADAMMTSMFGTLTKGLVNADSVSDPNVLLSLRIRALLFFASTRPLYLDLAKLDAFFDQTRKVLLLFGRSAEQRSFEELTINNRIKEAFHEILSIIQAKEGRLEGKAWLMLCEVVLHVAKRAKDNTMVETIACLMNPSTSDTTSSPDSQVSALCSKVISATAVLEEYRTSRQDSGVSDQIRRIIVTLPSLSRLRAQDNSIEAAIKIDKSLERMRRTVIQCIKGDKRSEELMTKEGMTIVPSSAIECLLVNLLDAMIKHIEITNATFSSKSLSTYTGRDNLLAGAVDSLLLLVHFTLAIDDRLSYTPVFDYLERGISLAGISFAKDGSISLDQLAQLYPLRSLVSTLYNIGGTLYNASRPESAIRFLQRSCTIGHAILGIDRSRWTDAAEIGMIGDLNKHMPKRWELLALSYHATSDKRAALGSYTSAILAHSPEVFLQISRLSASLAISILAAQFPALYKLIQRSTRIAVFDSLLPGRGTSLRLSLEGIACDSSVVGAMIELQIHSLEGNLYKSEALETISALLEELLELYTPEVYPVRRSRILVRRMQHQCTSGNPVQDLSLAATASEIDHLCTQDVLGNDDRLISFAPQYLAFSHLWLAFHAHQTGTATSSEIISTEARQALSILSSAFQSEIPSSPSLTVKISSPTSVVVVNRTEEVATTGKRKAVSRATVMKTPKMSRTAPATSRTVKSNSQLVTPPSRSSVSLIDRFSTPRRNEIQQQGKNLLDDPDRDYDLLETMANLLGALGYTLLRISFLKFLRRLASKRKSGGSDAFIATSAHLGREYLKLGKTTRAGLVFAQASTRLSQVTQSNTLSVLPTTRILYLSRYAEYLAMLGNHERSSQAYSDALLLSESLTPADPTSLLSASSRIVERTLALQRSAVAAEVISVMFRARGDLSKSLAPALQALRVWTRALSNVSRLSARESTSYSVDRPFDSDTTPTIDLKAPMREMITGARRRQPIHLTAQNGGLVWSLAESLVSSLLQVAVLYSIRGTPKSAEHFASQAIELAQDLGSPRLVARAMIARAEVRLRAGNSTDCEKDLDVVERILNSKSCSEAISLRRLRADLYLKTSLATEAHESYIDAQAVLDTFAEAAREDEGESRNSPMRASILRRSIPPSATSLSPARHEAASDRILSSVYSYLLRMRVSLLRSEGREDESRSLLALLSRLQLSDEDKADELLLLANIQLQDLLTRLASDPVFGMLQESILSIPALAIPLAKNAAAARSTTVAVSLKAIDALLSQALLLSASRTAPSKMQALSLQTAVLRTLQTSIGKVSKRSAGEVSNMLDHGVAITLRRDMLDAIDIKLSEHNLKDDLIWPSLVAAISTPPVSDSLDPMLSYWTSIRQRYDTSTSASTSLIDHDISSHLPATWTVISLHLTAKLDSLLLVRQRLNSSPLIFQLPLDRLARREGDEDAFTYAVASGELKEIIAMSNEGTQKAKTVDGREERAAWWKERKELDSRLKVLVQTMEEAWLGAFKSVLLDRTTFTTAATTVFKARIDTILKRSVTRAQDSKSNYRLQLDDTILESLAALPPECRDEDLEDMFYFMTESCQFTGVPVAYDEIDVDQVVCDIRVALEELHKSSTSTEKDSYNHTFLILDKSLQSFPWESIPCLRGRSVSRIPSTSFIRDRIDLATAMSSNIPTHEIIVDSSKTSYVLNAGGDLRKTQDHFEPWLQTMTQQHGWSGIVGRAPSEEEMKGALGGSELFLYFGHGGAEQYIRSQTIRHLPRCAVSMLWGCSSGLLKDLGDFDPIGTPYHYMLAGCPALVANLWDVTDKDIDLFSETVFTKLGLSPSPTPTTLTLTSAIATSRDVCNLKYLNGAAPVVYGVPVRFK